MIADKLSMTIENVDYYLLMQNMYYNLTSIDTNVKDSDETLKIVDTIEDENSLNPVEKLDNEERNKIIYDAISKLN